MLDLVAVPDIAGFAIDPHTKCLERRLGHQRLGADVPPGHLHVIEGDVDTVSREFHGDRPPNPSGAAGHHSHMPLQLPGRRPLWLWLRREGRTGCAAGSWGTEVLRFLRIEWHWPQHRSEANRT